MRRVSRVLGCEARAIALPFAEAAIDVDKPADLALVETILARRRRMTVPPRPSHRPARAAATAFRARSMMSRRFLGWVSLDSDGATASIAARCSTRWRPTWRR